MMWKVALVKYGGTAKSGDWTIKADNFDSERPAIEFAKGLVSQFPKNRYVVFQLVGVAAVMPNVPPVEFTRF